MTDQNEDKDKIDIAKILLPKKEGPSVDSAQRINAGALLAQEEKAGAEGPRQELPLKKSSDLSSAASTAVPAPPPVKKDEPLVKPLQTYQHDVESLVEHKDVSVVSIAAAEEKKRASEKHSAAPAAPWGRRALYWGGGVLLFAGAAGLAALILSTPTTVPVVPLNTQAPFITVDDTKTVQVSQGTRESLMRELDSARAGVSLPVGLIARLYAAVPGTTAEGKATLTEVPAQDLLGVVAPFAPEALLRTLRGPYLLGVHSFDSNQAFFILATDSYETAYAAMLDWENSMRQDLLPLFGRTPPVRQSSDATSTPAAPAVIQSGFVDRVVENHDARVVQTQFGDIVFLWTFLNRNTIAIATNEFTLREIISRATSAPTLNLPQ